MGDRKSAISLYNKAVENVNDKTNPKHLQQAYALFSAACLTDPTWPEALYQAGNNSGDLELIHSAIACYRRALECSPDNDLKAKIYTNLGWRLHCAGYLEEALEASLKATTYQDTLEPQMAAAAWTNLSCIYGVNFQLERSLDCARKAYAINGGEAQFEMALAFALLFARQFAQGFKHFEARFRYKLKEYLQYPYPKYDGEENRTVYLCADQGLGDTLSFARFVEPLCKRSRYVHARVQRELLQLFQHAFVHIPNLNLIPAPGVFPTADAWTTFMSLPTNLKLTDDEIRNARQIEIPRISMPGGWKIPDRQLHVGIAWAGSPLNEINRHRSIPVIQFLDLYKVPGVQLYSLQVGEHAKDMHDAGCAPLIPDLTPYISNVCDTIGLVRQLDLVITAESALGHICAAADVECWIPYSYLGRDYRLSADGKDMIWTPKHRVFQQSRRANWQPVFDTIVEALKEKIDGLSRQAAA